MCEGVASALRAAEPHVPLRRYHESLTDKGLELRGQSANQPNPKCILDFQQVFQFDSPQIFKFMFCRHGIRPFKEDHLLDVFYHMYCSSDCTRMRFFKLFVFLFVCVYLPIVYPPTNTSVDTQSGPYAARAAAACGPRQAPDFSSVLRSTDGGVTWGAGVSAKIEHAPPTAAAAVAAAAAGAAPAPPGKPDWLIEVGRHESLISVPLTPNPERKILNRKL